RTDFELAIGRNLVRFVLRLLDAQNDFGSLAFTGLYRLHGATQESIKQVEPPSLNLRFLRNRDFHGLSVADFSAANVVYRRRNRWPLLRPLNHLLEKLNRLFATANRTARSAITGSEANRRPLVGVVVGKRRLDGLISQQLVDFTSDGLLCRT